MKKNEWTQKRLEQLQADGKIRGFTKATKKAILAEQTIDAKIIAKVFDRHKSKAKNHIERTAMAWANQRGYQLLGEFKFHKAYLKAIGDTTTKPRNWRFDFTIQERMIAIEFDGGIFDANGSHRSMKDTIRDSEKLNMAATIGYTVLRFNAKNYESIQDELDRTEQPRQ